MVLLAGPDAWVIAPLRCREAGGVSYRRQPLPQARRTPRRTCVRNQPGGSAGRSVGMPWRRQIRWTAAAVQRPGRISGTATRAALWTLPAPPAMRRQGPAENPAAPNQHHHLVIVFADQLADPLTGRNTTGAGVDFPASRHDARHDTHAAGIRLSRCRRLLQARFWPRSGADPRRDFVAVGPRGRPKSPFSPGRPDPRPTAGQCIKSLIGEIFAFPFELRFRKPWETSESSREFRKQIRVFFVSSRSGTRGPQNRLRRFWRNPRSELAPLAERWTDAGCPMPNPSPSRARPTQAL